MKGQMSANLRSSFTAWLVLTATSAIDDSAAAAIPRTISLYVSDMLLPDGSVSYSVRPSLLIHSQLIETLTSPSGFVYDGDPLNAPSFATFESALQGVVGEWTLRTAFANNPADSEEYRFSVSSFDGNDIAVERPTISPPTGSRVQSPFQVMWEPPRSGYGYNTSGIGATADLIEPGKLEVNFTVLSATGSMQLSATDSQRLHGLVSSVVSPADPAFELTVDVSYLRGRRVEYTPIPEPNVSLLSCMGLVMMYSRWRRGGDLPRC